MQSQECLVWEKVMWGESDVKHHIENIRDSHHIPLYQIHLQLMASQIWQSNLAEMIIY